jgi:hypothetical protein
MGAEEVLLVELSTVEMDNFSLKSNLPFKRLKIAIKLADR